MNALKYLFTLTLPNLVAIALTLKGFWVWMPVIYSFGLIPLLELGISPDSKNLSAAEEAVRKEDRLYDYVIYLMVGVLYVLLGYFLYIIQAHPLEGWEFAGLIASMGLMCGTYGINVGHELGHRKKKGERTLAKISLLSSLYMHFFIEHNRGHHKRVATEEDPASARKGENLYAFWFRSIAGSYRSAWEIENQRLRSRKLPAFSLKNEMLVFHLIQGLFLVSIFAIFGWRAGGAFMGAAVIGILLLETVNYIEHYGLSRKKLASGKYERTQVHHSWNSNHILGRLMLFELSRHSDHHYMASRKYQILRHHDESPNMPTGYPGMMVLALFPPLWFLVMHRRIGKYEENIILLQSSA